jgi:hypothetical protein
MDVIPESCHPDIIGVLHSLRGNPDVEKLLEQIGTAQRKAEEEAKPWEVYAKTRKRTPLEDGVSFSDWGCDKVVARFATEAEAEAFRDGLSEPKCRQCGHTEAWHYGSKRLGGQGCGGAGSDSDSDCGYVCRCKAFVAAGGS